MQNPLFASLQKIGGLATGQTLSLHYYYEGATGSGVMNFTVVHFQREQASAVELHQLLNFIIKIVSGFAFFHYVTLVFWQGVSVPSFPI